MTMNNANENKTVKMTKKDYFNQLLQIKEVQDNIDLYNFCAHELDLLAKKASASNGKPTKKQVENEALITDIANILNDLNGDAIAIADLQQKAASLQECSQQKLSALLKKLVDAGKAERVKDKKGKTFYKSC